MGARSSVEQERKYDLPPGALVPDLVGVGSVKRVRSLSDESLEATYWDTEDQRLVSAGVTLRSRRGGRDSGWHLKLPVGGDKREEVTLPLDDPAAVPAELQSLVRSRIRSAALRPVATIRTHRRVLQLISAGGEVLAEVADDRVAGERGAERQEWREVEVELIEGDSGLLDAIEACLEGAGAVRSPAASKLARVLDPPRAVPDDLTLASGAVLAHLREQIDELTARDPGTRRDRPDSLHKMRVATRRLRSALSTYRPLLDRERTDPLRDELKHLAAVLGEARDAEVMRDHLQAQVAALPAELVVGPVVERIDRSLHRQHGEAHERVLDELDGPRYLALLEALSGLLSDPPFTAKAKVPAAPELRHLVRRSMHHLEAAAQAVEVASGPERDLLLHEVRKKGKQVRYATESTQAVLGRDAGRFAKAVTSLQEVLGDHQDSVVLRERLTELADDARAAGEDTFTYGVLHGLEQARGTATVAAYPAEWRRLRRKRSRRWLKG